MLLYVADKEATEFATPFFMTANIAKTSRQTINFCRAVTELVMLLGCSVISNN